MSCTVLWCVKQQMHRDEQQVRSCALYRCQCKSGLLRWRPVRVCILSHCFHDGASNALAIVVNRGFSISVTMEDLESGKASDSVASVQTFCQLHAEVSDQRQ